jgi:hypothetical protein
MISLSSWNLHSSARTDNREINKYQCYEEKGGEWYKRRRWQFNGSYKEVSGKVNLWEIMSLL